MPAPFGLDHYLYVHFNGFISAQLPDAILFTQKITVMKPLTIVACAFAISAFFSCRQGNNIDITYSDADRIIIWMLNLIIEKRPPGSVSEQDPGEGEYPVNSEAAREYKCYPC
jgi:hypothetical protein